MVLDTAVDGLLMALRQKIGSVYHVLFGDIGRTFGTVSSILLLILAIAPAKDYLSEWRCFQKKYANLVHGRVDAASLEKRLPHGIQQIWIPEQGIVDRCTTCHVALNEASLRDVPQQPFRLHPRIPHTLTEFGCVVCHGGQGRATTVEEAHYSTAAWKAPLRPAKYIESGCGQCHLAPLPGTPKLNEGRHLLAREGCVRCHVLKMADGALLQGTDTPSSLAHIADKTTREWIYAWLKDPQAYSISATMPNFGFGDGEARDISAFLIAQSVPLHPGQVAEPAAAAASSAATVESDLQAGTSLYGQLFCSSCHAVQNAYGVLLGGDFGPELTKIGSKVKPQWLAAWLRNPADFFTGTKMPHYRLDNKQIGLLMGFLLAKKDDDLLANVHLPDATPEQITHGRALVADYGCASCHEINGVKKPENFAPELTAIGSKPFAQIAFPPGVPHTLPDFLAAKVRKPRAFAATLKMPQFKLTEQQIEAISTALLAQTDRARTQPSRLRLASLRDSNYQAGGNPGRLIDDLRCFSCHRIQGRGGDMAPDLTWEGSSVQREWLLEFFKNPGTLRPTLIRRMPKFNLTDAEINTLTDYIMTVYQMPPPFNRDEIPAGVTPALAEQGRQLFYTVYACQSCHVIDDQKDRGYIGPTLWNVGKRLNANWVYHWLKDPQSLRPGTLEPNRNMSDDDARALTAFLMSLKSAGKQGAQK
jgi:mono/diheme cytochrome c family protein